RPGVTTSGTSAVLPRSRRVRSSSAGRCSSLNSSTGPIGRSAATDDRTAREELTMTTVTVRPIRDDLSLGARVGGVTLDQLSDPEVRARLNEAFEERGLLIFEGV